MLLFRVIKKDLFVWWAEHGIELAHGTRNIVWTSFFSSKLEWVGSFLYSCREGLFFMFVPTEGCIIVKYILSLLKVARAIFPPNHLSLYARALLQRLPTV